MDDVEPLNMTIYQQERMYLQGNSLAQGAGDDGSYRLRKEGVEYEKNGEYARSNHPAGPDRKALTSGSVDQHPGAQRVNKPSESIGTVHLPESGGVVRYVNFVWT